MAVRFGVRRVRSCWTAPGARNVPVSARGRPSFRVRITPVLRVAAYTEREAAGGVLAVPRRGYGAGWMCSQECLRLVRVGAFGSSAGRALPEV